MSINLNNRVTLTTHPPRQQQHNRKEAGHFDSHVFIFNVNITHPPSEFQFTLPPPTTADLVFAHLITDWLPLSFYEPRPYYIYSLSEPTTHNSANSSILPQPNKGVPFLQCACVLIVHSVGHSKGQSILSCGDTTTYVEWKSSNRSHILYSYIGMSFRYR